MKPSIKITVFSLNNKGRIKILDFFRAFSIITIVLMHLIQNYLTDTPDFIKAASSLGGTGVHVFFFASGCGLYLSYLKHHQSIKRFFIKRFIKVYIPYIIVIFISFLLPWMYQGQNRIVALLSNVFLFKMFMPQYENSFGCQMWYLSTLFQLYLFFYPLCKIREKISGKYFIIVSIIISLLYATLITSLGLSEERVINSFFLQFLWEFCLGMELARVLRDGKVLKIHTYQLILVTIIGLGLEGLISLRFPIFKGLNDIPAFFGYISLATLLYIILGKLKTKSWERVCKYSYEWYLVHILVFSTIFLIHPVSLSNQLLIGLVALIASYLIAVIYYYLLHIKKLI